MSRVAPRLAAVVAGVALAVVLVMGLAPPNLAFAAVRPAVTHVRPASGSTLGGNTVTIQGTRFKSHGHSLVKKVMFGMRPATGVKVHSATWITVRAPKGTGTVNVRVTAVAGTSAKVSVDKYTYKAPGPAISRLSPAIGTTLGGTVVTISGTGLSGATAVDFGPGNPATFTVDSATQITATAPAGGGTVDAVVDVTVTTPAGTSATAPADRYTYHHYASAAISGVSPNVGPAAGGTKVTITGYPLYAATAVKFGTAVASFKVYSDSKIVATAPAGTGTVDVTVTTPAGISAPVSADRYTYVPEPSVTGLSPKSGPESGSTSVTISGAGLSDATAVEFGPGNPATITADSATQITATAPAGSGTVDVTVTTAGGTSAVVSADEYTYVAPLIAVTGTSAVADVEVANGTTLSDALAALPTTVGITLSDASSATADVTWAAGNPAYDGSTAGAYPFVGTLSGLPAGVTNPGGVTAAVNVDVAAPL